MTVFESHKREVTREVTREVVLVVDRSTRLLEELRPCLAVHYVVMAARDEGCGFHLAKKKDPALVICDDTHNNGDGELWETLKGDSRTRHIPVILINGKLADREIVHALETGLDDYMTRPVNAEILIAKVKNLIHLRRQMERNIQMKLMTQGDPLIPSSADMVFLGKLRSTIEENLANPLLKVEDILEPFYTSRSSFYRRVQSLTGMTPQLFIRSCRLARAARLLENNENNVTEVCFNVGFTSTAYFSKCFKDKFQMSPRAFKCLKKFRPGLSEFKPLTQTGI